MKIPRSIRTIYQEQFEICERMKKIIDNRMTSIKNPQWHYESRIKELSSFCLKIESGRFDIKGLEDTFACTLVVRNATEILTAEKKISEYFNIKYKRPNNPHFTHKDPESFPFDDLRIYATLSKDISLPDTGLENIIFEIQLKTFLQHAWTIATHDLVYKTDDENWGKQRIAFQIKAMLEHAELSILEADRLSKSNAISKKTNKTENILSIMSIIKSHWDEPDLPTDLKRLSENISSLLGALKKDNNYLNEILNKEKHDNHGSLPLNLSPYGTIIQSIIKYDRKIIIEYITKKQNNRKKFRIVIHPEIEFPPEIKKENFINAILF